MQSTGLENLKLSLFGESHGEAIGIVIDGLAPGIELDFDFINAQLEKRKAKGKISTQRKEDDNFKILSGFFNGYTTGTSLCIMIENKKQHSKDYSKTKDIMRPSHADFTANMKYLGFQDYRGGGHFSGRLTAPIVAAGAIAMQILNSKGIKIGTQIKKLKNIEAPSITTYSDIKNVIKELNSLDFAVIDEDIKEQMRNEILMARENLDSVGGVLESVIHGLPAGFGEPFFHSIESELSRLLFSIPSVKGVEFGSGFDITNYYGSEVNDSFVYEDGFKTRTNHNGGINGGISNGMPIIVKTAIKPTPSIYKEQQSVNIQTKENVKFNIEGRHDPAIIHRARVVQDSMLALGILDLIIGREGYMWMVK